MAQPVAIVTGGASGIGLACTKNLLARGYKVCIGDADQKAGEAALTELGENTTFVRCDVSAYNEQATLFARAFHWGGGRLDFLAANAGIDDRQSLYESNETTQTEKVKIDGVDVEVEVPAEMNIKTIKVDLDAVLQGVWLFKWFNRRSKDAEGKSIGKGKIVCTSSVAGI
jgi:15-hydroxyprostaglandin dehydrogenase (NAD)